MRKLLLLLTALCMTLSVNQYGTQHSFGSDELQDEATHWFIMMTAKPLSPGQLSAKYRMYNMLCFELRDIDCSGIPAPEVATFPRNPFRPGLAGYYDGSDTVYIREDLMGREREDVLAHEMSHYLDVMILDLKVPGPALEICKSEVRAWAVSDSYWTKYGRYDRVVGEDWVNWYSHCTPLKDLLYPDESGS
jgi:hypothetical protein